VANSTDTGSISNIVHYYMRGVERALQRATEAIMSTPLRFQRGQYLAHTIASKREERERVCGVCDRASK
jgi:hypothetical protein